MDMLREPVPVIGTGEWSNFQCLNFKESLKIGDIILVRKGRVPLALCRITSESFTDLILTSKYFNINFRHVEILDFYSGNECFPQAQGTLQKLINSHTQSWKFIDKWLNNIFNKMDIDNIINLLEEKKQVILQGAPGTGKTYITAAVSLSLMGEEFDPADHKGIMKKYDKLVNEKRIFFTTFHQSMDYEDFVEGLKPVIDDDNMTYEIKDGIFKTICKTAEQSGSLDAFDNAIEQLKHDCSEAPITAKTKNNVNFSVSYRNGKTFRVRSHNSAADEGKDFPANIESIKAFYRGETSNIYNISYVRGLCNYIMETYGVKPYSHNGPNLKYLLIIDEINRGNISKIFGELITLLEADKRSEGEHPIKIRLAYSHEENFSVPSNLYILGTMNTTDRSVGYIDYAVRRRFAFYTLSSNRDAIISYYADPTNGNDRVRDIALSLFDGIKDFITRHITPDFDIQDIMIGHSYFMARNADSLRRKLEYEIIPLLKEYEKDGIISFRKEEFKELTNSSFKLFGPQQ